MSIILPGFLALVLFGFVTFAYLVPHIKDALISQKRESMRHIVGSVINLLESFEAQIKAGLIDPGIAKEQALYRIGHIRYGSGNNDYIWINDLTPRMLMHPYAKTLVGRDLSEYRDSKGAPIFMDMVGLVREKGQGFVTYNWQCDDQPLADLEKISFVRHYEPWGWMIGTGNSLVEIKAGVAALTRKLMWAGFGAFALVSLATLYLIGRSMSSEAARNQSLNKLKQSEEKYRDLFNSATEGIFFFKDGAVLDVNPAAEAMLGYGRGELKGKTPLEFAPHWQEPGLTSQKYYEQCREIVMAAGSHSFEWLLVHKDGRIIVTEVAISKAGHEEGVFLALVKNISQRKKSEHEREALQRQLQQSQKMEAIGTLAGGIAHDFNNILTVIQGNAEVARARLGQPKYNPAKQLDEVITASQRARDLVRQILSYSRQTGTAKHRVNLSEILDETVRMLESATMGRVDIRVNSPEKPLLVMGNPTQLQQVIMNIANNGIQAIEETGAPGLLEIWLDWTQDMGPAKGRGGGRCCMVFKDNGAGMNSEQIQRAFDPFFTTKPVGKGTGLGLSVVYGIVKDHGGEITISSQIGAGTEITVNLPAVGKRALKVVGG